MSLETKQSNYSAEIEDNGLNSPNTIYPSVMISPIPAPGEEVTVLFQTTGSGTATPGEDYTASSGSHTFSNSNYMYQGEAFKIPLTPDETPEPDETIGVDFSFASGTAGTGTSGSFTITDNDGYGGGTGSGSGSGTGSGLGAASDSTSVVHDHALAVAAPGVLGNDYLGSAGTSALAVMDTPPQHSVSFQLHGDGSFDYIPSAGWIGTDFFTYHILAGGVSSNIATATIQVHNTAPSGIDDSGYWTLDDQDLIVDAAAGLLQNDYDADGDPLQVILETLPQHGVLTINGDGSFRYDADDGYFGPDGFQYRATDGIEQSGLVAVQMQVARLDINLTPPAGDDEVVISDNVTDKTTEMWVGERVILSTKLRNAMGRSVMSVDWIVPVEALKGYTANALTGQKHPLTAGDTHNLTLEYNWLKPGASIVKAHAVLSNGTIENKKTSFTVKAPNVTVATDPIDGPPLVGGPPGSPDLKVALQTMTEPGIKFEKATSDAPAGTYQWVQLVDTRMLKTPLQGNPQILQGYGLLDSDYPYAMGESTTDSPFFFMKQSDKQWDRNDIYHMYFEWTSSRTGSIPIAVRRIDWHWDFSIQHVAPYGEMDWHLLFNSLAVDANQAMSDLPEWSQNVTSLTWQVYG